MEHLDEPRAFVLAAVGAATLCFLYWLLRTHAEAPVSYIVAPPEQAQPSWRGAILEQPSLKVRRPFMMQRKWAIGNRR